MKWASLKAQSVKNLPAMQETEVQLLGQEDPLEKEMAIHSSILAWKILWTEEAGGLQSMGSQDQTWLSDQTTTTWEIQCFFSGSVVKKDVSFIPGSGRSPGGRHGNPLQYSCLENPMDRRAWQTTVHMVAKSWTSLKWLNQDISSDASWEICIQVRKQQLELDMEQQTGSK